MSKGNQSGKDSEDTEENKPLTKEDLVAKLESLKVESDELGSD